MSDPKFTIERASETDREAILEVMRPWNMHHVPSPEMEEIDLSAFFVARSRGQIVGAAGYKVTSQTMGKTTLLGVLPQFNGMGMGAALQHARCETMHRVGVKRVITNCDLPQTVAWYKKRFGYTQVGTLKKVCSFGDPKIDRWTTLEMDLDAYMAQVDQKTARQKHVARHEPHPLAPYPPLLINACLTGMIPTRDQTSHVPLTEDEIIADAVRVYDAGARIVHMHARDADGRPTWRAEVYEKIIRGIRAQRPQVICCVSTSGRNWSEFEKRSEVLLLEGDARPDMASLTLGSLNFPTSASVNTPQMIEQLAALMAEKQIRPELEIFDVGMIGVAKYLERKGILSGRKVFNLLLGSLGTIPATIGNLSSLVGSLPDDSVWAATGIGMFQLPMNVAAIVAGGGVRVGLEDTIHYDYARTQLASNEQLVKRLVTIADQMQRPIATAEETREMVGL